MGDKSGTLAVNYSVGGTGTSGDDFTALSGSVVFAAGEVHADVAVDALHDGAEDPDETVTATVTSGTGYTPSGPAATVNLIDTDLLPVAFDGWETTSVNEPVVVAVLDLATSLYGDTLTVTGVTQGSDGSTVVNGNGTVTYTPDTDFSGDDSFTYTVEDQFGNEATGTVSVTVTRPLAPPTSVWTDVNTAVTVEVLDMAFDPDGDTLTTTAVTQGSHGSVVLNGNGTVTYTPNTSYTGDDSFTYTVEDPDGNEATHTITVTVGGIDPVALDDEVVTPVNTAVNFEVEDLAFDPAGDTLEVVSVTQGAHGTVVINLDGSVTYTPNTSYTGPDSFTYTVEDDDSNTSTGTIDVTVGTPPPTEADEIVDDLEAIEDEIENYDEDTPGTIQGMIPNVVNAITNYVGNVTAFINATSIDPNAADKMFKDFVTQVVASYNATYRAYIKLLDLEAQLRTTLVANGNLIGFLKEVLQTEKMAANPNATQIAGLQEAIKTLQLVRGSLLGEWLKIDLVGAYNELVLQKDSLKRSYGGLPAFVTLPDPPLPPMP
jgi:VCBS repeat-containing protein